MSRVGEAALIESIQPLTLPPSNLLIKLLREKPKKPPITAIESGTVAALGKTTVEISVLIHDLTSGVTVTTTLFCLVILEKKRVERRRDIKL